MGNLVLTGWSGQVFGGANGGIDSDSRATSRRLTTMTGVVEELKVLVTELVGRISLLRVLIERCERRCLKRRRRCRNPLL